jgi:cytochrome b pre-mRNA-processing protein 3
MFKRLFGIGSNPNRIVVDELYGQIVAAARQPVFYSDWSTPDTPLGRFEMISLTLFLTLRRLRGENGTAAEVAQDLVDTFFKELDHSIRELGIGDMGVPKRMKKLAKMFYGRAGSYGKALDDADEAALAEALRRNIQPTAAEWPGARHLARYTLAAAGALANQPLDEILAGVVLFPSPADVPLGELA